MLSARSVSRGRDEKSTFQNILHEEVYFPRPPTPALRKKFHISSEAKASDACSLSLFELQCATRVVPPKDSGSLRRPL